MDDCRTRELSKEILSIVNQIALMTQKNIDENSYLLSRLVDKSISQTILLKCGSYSTLKLLVYELILLLFEQKEDRKGNKDKQDSSNINVYHSLSSYIEHIQIRLKHFEQKTLRFSLTKVQFSKSQFQALTEDWKRLCQAMNLKNFSTKKQQESDRSQFEYLNRILQKKEMRISQLSNELAENLQEQEQLEDKIRQQESKNEEVNRLYLNLLAHNKAMQAQIQSLNKRILQKELSVCKQDSQLINCQLVDRNTQTESYFKQNNGFVISSNKMVADKEPATRIIEDFPTVDKTNRIEYDNETVKHKTDKKTVNKSIQKLNMTPTKTILRERQSIVAHSLLKKPSLPSTLSGSHASKSLFQFDCSMQRILLAQATVIQSQLHEL